MGFKWRGFHIPSNGLSSRQKSQQPGQVVFCFHRFKGAGASGWYFSEIITVPICLFMYTLAYDMYMDVSENSGRPQIIHFKRVFHNKPSVLEYPYFWKHPYIYIYTFLRFKVRIVKLGGAFHIWLIFHPDLRKIFLVDSFFWGLKPPSSKHRRSLTKHLRGELWTLSSLGSMGPGRKISTSPDVWVGVSHKKTKMDGTVHTSWSKRGPFMYIQYIDIHV